MYHLQLISLGDCDLQSYCNSLGSIIKIATKPLPMNACKRPISRNYSVSKIFLLLMITKSANRSVISVCIEVLFTFSSSNQPDFMIRSIFAVLTWHKQACWPLRLQTGTTLLLLSSFFPLLLHTILRRKGAYTKWELCFYCYTCTGTWLGSKKFYVMLLGSS